MKSTMREVLEAIRTTLRGVDGSGAYTYDLSDTADRVHVGAPPTQPAVVPSVWIHSATMQGSQGQGTPLGMYRREFGCVIAGYVGAADDSPGARVLAAADLADDIHRALESNRSLSGHVLDLTVTSAPINGEDLGLPSLGFVGAEVSAYWRVETGA